MRDIPEVNTRECGQRQCRQCCAEPHQNTCPKQLEAESADKIPERQSESVIHALRDALRTRLHRRRRDGRHLASHTHALQTDRNALQQIERHVPPDAGHQRVAREAQHICAEYYELRASEADARDQHVRKAADYYQI